LFLGCVLLTRRPTNFSPSERFFPPFLPFFFLKIRLSFWLWGCLFGFCHAFGIPPHNFTYFFFAALFFDILWSNPNPIKKCCFCAVGSLGFFFLYPDLFLVAPCVFCLVVGFPWLSVPQDHCGVWCSGSFIFFPFPSPPCSAFFSPKLLGTFVFLPSFFRFKAFRFSFWPQALFNFEQQLFFLGTFLLPVGCGVVDDSRVSFHFRWCSPPPQFVAFFTLSSLLTLDPCS